MQAAMLNKLVNWTTRKRDLKFPFALRLPATSNIERPHSSTLNSNNGSGPAEFAPA